MLNFFTLPTLSAAAGAAALTLFFFQGACAPVNSNSLEQMAGESRRSLANGLLALDRGDKQEALGHLENALALDPSNMPARSALASLHASTAGIELRHWLDQFAFSADVLDRYTLLMRSFGLESESQAGQILLGVSVIVNSFLTIPELNDTQKEALDKAIQTLRNPDPNTFSEELRAYLSVLTTIRFVNDARQFFFEGRNLVLNRLSHMDDTQIRAQFAELRRDLLILEESTFIEEQLRVDPTPSRRARLQVQEVVRKLNELPLWADLTDQALELSERLESDLRRLRAGIASGEYESQLRSRLRRAAQ